MARYALGVSREQIIEDKLSEGLAPIRLEVLDESYQHSVPAGAESHFSLLVVSAAFEGLARVARHRRVYQLLGAELAQGLHALTMTLMTPDELAVQGGEAIASPACVGGSKAS